MRIFTFLYALLFCTALSAQTNVGLIAYYPFEQSLEDVTGNTANTGTATGNPQFVCGVKGESILLNGAGDQVSIPGGNVNAEFDTEDFSVSFYFKPVGMDGVQYLLSKRSPDCNNENVFYIRYVPATRTINAYLSEIPEKTVSLVYTIKNDACWQNVVLVRDNFRVKMFVNGNFAGDLGTATRIDLDNNGKLIIGSANCRSGSEVPFKGMIDELRFYNRALDDREVKGLYSRPDMIVNPDTLLFLGNSIDIELTNTCASTFTWTTDGTLSDLSSTTTPDPTITPSQAGPFIYHLQMENPVSPCSAHDSIRINVVDPDELECDELFLPKAFTPNGDGLNDTYGISNPFAVQELISFEIFDRWGGRMFAAENTPFAQWDGTFRGERVNSGVMIYKIIYICDNVERLASGSFSLLR
ncbi:MAG: hypothetical protein DHS20C18_47970 [Saprospiraceae bacterium]|nr:MAG: hypothetical protein DHS20C18_47970 [Saprospiraceae bacterium]